jgi:hypothetical protein
MFLFVATIVLLFVVLYLSYKPTSLVHQLSYMKRIAFDSSVQAPPGSTITVSVGPKEPGFIGEGKGGPVGYYVTVKDKDKLIVPKVQTNELILQKNSSYYLQRDQRDSHPMILSSTSLGTRKDALPNQQEFFEKEIQTNSLPSTFYISCANHPYMGFKVIVQ